MTCQDHPSANDDAGFLRGVNQGLLEAARSLQAGELIAGFARLDELIAQCGLRLGEDHRQTIRVRSNRAAWLGETGDPEAARRELLQLYRKALCAWGDKDPDTVLIGSNAASFTGVAGEPLAAAEMLRRLIPIAEATFADGSPALDAMRGNLRVWDVWAAVEA